MKSIEFFESMINELIEDRSYYRGELNNIEVNPNNPSWAMMQKRSYKKLIEECNQKIEFYRNGINALMELAA